METVKDCSYGVVPVIEKDGEWRVLLIHQISYRGSDDRFWTFPKGHPEAGENPIDTAKRELAEETNISDVQIIKEAKFTIQYSFAHEGKTINKTVTYYLGICKSEKVKILIPEEIANLAWFTLEEAAQKLTHPNTQKVLLEASQYLNKHPNKI